MKIVSRLSIFILQKFEEPGNHICRPMFTTSALEIAHVSKNPGNTNNIETQH